MHKLGSLAEPALKEALAGRPPLEVRQRLERLLERAAQEGMPLTELRRVRALEVLEQAGTVEARKAIEAMARTEAKSPSTLEAKTSLERLKRRATVMPD